MKKRNHKRDRVTIRTIEESDIKNIMESRV